MVRQRTLKETVKATGVGLHSGLRSALTLRPSTANTGVIYRRIDLDPPVDIPADARLVRDTTLCTALVNDEGIRVSTVEHLSAALLGTGVDNIIIEVDAPEIPIMDGSARPFIFLIEQAGIEFQNVPKRFIRVKNPIRVEDCDRWVEITPFDGLRIDFRIEFDHPAMAIEQQRLSFEFSPSSFLNRISRARTFGFLKDIEYFQSQSLCLGGSLDCAIVLDNCRILNEEGLRFSDELVAHKVLDAMGDLYIGGHPIIGDFRAYKSGHRLNNQLLRSLLTNQEAWEWVTYKREALSPIPFIDFPTAAT